MESDYRWQPAVRMRDSWYERPLVALACWATVILFLWWGRDGEPAHLGQVIFPTALFLMWWAGRERQLAKRIEVLADAVQGLQAVTHEVLQSGSRADPAK